MSGRVVPSGAREKRGGELLSFYGFSRTPVVKTLGYDQPVKMGSSTTKVCQEAERASSKVRSREELRLHTDIQSLELFSYPRTLSIYAQQLLTHKSLQIFSIYFSSNRVFNCG